MSHGRRALVNIELRVVSGTPEVGLWCDTCQTSARVRIPIYILNESVGNPVGEIGVANACSTGCGLETVSPVEGG